MTNPTLFEQMMDAPPEIGVYVGVPAFCEFPAYTIPLTDEAVDMLGARFASRRPASTSTAPKWVVGADDSLSNRWWSFHGRHPDVYVGLVHLARQARRRGMERLGISMIYEVLRWQTMMGAEVPHEEPFKLNNDYRAYYARFIMETCPDLDGIFMKRAVRADREE